MNAASFSVPPSGRLVLMTLTLLGGVALAGTSKGVLLFNARQYAQALPELLAPANAGDGTAQFYLGQLYENGSGVTRDS